jgi:hypothetical protein
VRWHRVLPALATLAALVAPPATAASVAPPSMRQLVTALGGRASDAASPRWRDLRKLDGHLQGLAADRLQRRPAASLTTGGLSLSGDRVLVDVYVDHHADAAEAARQLRAAGMDVTHVADRAPARVVEGWLPIERAPGVAALGATRAVVPVNGFGVDAGSTLSEGDAAMHGPQARALGPDGAGVPVGVISDSIGRVGGGVAASQASGDLPASVQVLQDGPNGSSDEGRAMAEIVYDEAPGIPSILFSTGATGAVQKAASIDALVAHGAKVIVDDTFYIGEPFFQDGIVAQAVDRARAAGVAYISSAGNRARQSWEGTFSSDPVNATLNNFDPGGVHDTFQTVSNVAPGGTRFLELQWDEPWGAATSSFQVNVFADGVPLGSVTNAAGIPATFFSFTAGGSPHALRIQIERLTGSGPVRLKYIAGGNATYSIAEYPTNSATIDPDAASAAGALTVAAVDRAQPGLDVPEAFSSRGPVTRLFDASGARLAAPQTRAKPDLAAADDVSTGVPGFKPFLGTSAAAPSAAGVAALLLSAKPSMSVDQLYGLMRNPAATIPCAAPAVGTAADDCGAGFLLADAALRALDSTPPAIGVTTTPAAPNAAGWFNRPVVPHWSVSDPETAIGAHSGCDATPLAADGADTAVCSATSLGGSASRALTVRIDTTPPSAPRIVGVAARRYTAATLPRASAIRCTAEDPTSGVTRCFLSGFTGRSGDHVLTATAVDGAGLSSTTVLRYAVAPTIAAGQAPRSISLAALARGGLPVRLRVEQARTRLVVRLALAVRSHGRRRSVVVARLVATAGTGTHTLHVQLVRGARRLLAAHRGAPLALTIVGARGRVSTTLAGTVRATA